jgi:hypothetical protein
MKKNDGVSSGLSKNGNVKVSFNVISKEFHNVSLDFGELRGFVENREES